MRPPERLETPRLVLRPPVMGDDDAIFTQYAQDPEVTRYLVWRPHTGIAETRAFLTRCLQAWETGTAFPWVLTVKGDGRLLGMIELRLSGFMADMGYALARTYWGQGYTSEAAGALAGWALSQAAIFRVWAVCDVENGASARVLEKIGMRREGVLRRWLVHPNLGDEPRDCFCYAMTK